MNLPYTWTDSDGDELRVVAGHVSISKETSGQSTVYAPTGPDAVALARAVLAAAGNAGCEVVAAEDMAKMRQAAMEAAATVMRERAAHVVSQRDYAGHGEDNAEAIRALPLLPTPTPVTADNTKETT